MNAKKKNLFSITGLLMTILVSGQVVAGEDNDDNDYTRNCSTLEKISEHIPEYAYSGSDDHHDDDHGDDNHDDDNHDNSKKVTICHNTSSASNPFTINNISTSALKTHLDNHNDYFSKTGVCPTASLPCPPVTCSSPLVLNTAGGYCILGQSEITPTVNILSTYDTTPVLTGTVGTLALVGLEAFTVTVNNVPYVYRASSALTVSGTTWTLLIPNSLPVNTYEVTAKRVDIPDTTLSELTIKACHAPNVLNTTTDTCSSVSRIPTVNALTTTITAPSIIVSGTVGDVALGSDTFSVKVSNAAYANIAGVLTVSDLTWTYTLTNRYEGIFNVNAIRAGASDPTSEELTITDFIDICDTGVDKTINRSTWVGSKEGSTYYLGKCSCPAACTPPPVTSAVVCTDTPPPYTPVVTQELCDNGGVKSDTSINTVTVKQAQIVNASTENGTVSESLVGGKVKYGIKNGGSLNLVSDATINQNQATGVTLTNVTLKNASIDVPGSVACTSSDGTWSVSGGTTKPATTKADGTLINGTIISGVITEGRDANNKPIRGKVTTGTYDTDIVNLNNVVTKGRRVSGTLTNATITNAQTTTINGTTYVIDGIISSGEMSPNAASTFGTVFNATLINTNNVSSTNHCFTSGTVGARGQLNWREVIKE